MHGEGGTLTVDIHNNVFRDLATFGVQLNPVDTVSMRVDLVGNTIDRAGTSAIVLAPGLDPGGKATLNAFGNIVSRAGGAAFDVRAGSGITFRAGYNDLFANGRTFPAGAGLSAGPGTLRLDPRYVDAAGGDLRLRSTSPLIDRGRACTRGGLEALDAAGRFRWAGRDVDMGAYERGAGAPSGVVRVGSSASQSIVGTAGRDVLCGLGGNDTLTGRGGRDYLDGGAGNDTLCARDGVRANDIARGGSGRDRGRLDARDKRISIERTGGC